MESSAEHAEPKRDSPMQDRREPRRAAERTLTVDPSEKKSSTDSEDANLSMP